MKKRLTKVLALGLTAVMIIGTPLSAVAAEITPTDVSVTNEATEDEQAVTDETAEETTACENSDSTEQTDDAADVAEVQFRTIIEILRRISQMFRMKLSRRSQHRLPMTELL